MLRRCTVCAALSGSGRPGMGAPGIPLAVFAPLPRDAQRRRVGVVVHFDPNTRGGVIKEVPRSPPHSRLEDEYDCGALRVLEELLFAGDREEDDDDEFFTVIDADSAGKSRTNEGGAFEPSSAQGSIVRLALRSVHSGSSGACAALTAHHHSGGDSSERDRLVAARARRSVLERLLVRAKDRFVLGTHRFSATELLCRSPDSRPGPATAILSPGSSPPPRAIVGEAPAEDRACELFMNIERDSRHSVAVGTAVEFLVRTRPLRSSAAAGSGAGGCGDIWSGAVVPYVAAITGAGGAMLPDRRATTTTRPPPHEEEAAAAGASMVVGMATTWARDTGRICEASGRRNEATLWWRRAGRGLAAGAMPPL